MHWNNKNPENRDFLKGAGISDRIIIFFATWFWTGFIPFGAGTWGSLAALPFAAGAYSLGVFFSCLSLLIIVILSIPVAGKASRIMKHKDPSFVVIDEAAGIFMTFFWVPVSWTSIIIGFVLFRLFDIVKPWPAGLIDKKLEGGAGIVLDDVVAGVYANVFLRAILIFID